jgi:hypothetical protein
MIKLVATKTSTYSTNYGNENNFSESNFYLIQVEPHIMKYSYASKEYFLSVPWLYFLMRDTTFCNNWGNKDRWSVSRKSTFNEVYFSYSDLNESLLIPAPLSNANQGSLCFNGIPNYNRNLDNEEKDNFLSSFKESFNENCVNLFNEIYSEFTNGAGNNDYKYGSVISYSPIIFWFQEKMNRSIKNWPSYFKRWQSMGEIPLHFWPSEIEDIKTSFSSQFLDGFETNPYFSNYFLNVDLLCGKHDLEQHIVCI